MAVNAHFEHKMNTHLSLTKGWRFSTSGAPEQKTYPGPDLTEIAVLGQDYPSIRPDFRVKLGDKVRTGDVLFVDRKRPQIAFTAPATGVIKAINLKPKRLLDAVIIATEVDDPISFKVPPHIEDRDTLVSLLLVSGLWTSFISRPFGYLPDVDAIPRAIFVNAMDTNPHAVDPCFIINSDQVAFQTGLMALTHLTEGAVFVCQPVGADFAPSDRTQIRTVSIAGHHPNGLSGTHIHHLMPVSAQRSVWQIAYYDVIRIGYLLKTGQIRTDVTVALSGPGFKQARIVSTLMGANLTQLLAGEISEEQTRAISGSLLSGYEAKYLGRYHTQVSVLAPSPEDTNRFWNGLKRFISSASQGPLIPSETFDAAFPFDIPATPLMRALSVGDVETAQRLGCLELLEEDVAILSYLCPGKANYGALLRHILDDIAGVRR